MKKDKNYIWLILLTLGIIIISLGFGNLYGSTTDWLSQHSAYPEYFRNLFYETGELFPSFAPNIGSGQNIYNFSYYGLLNPVYMISYLLPNVKMVDYLMVVSILSVLISVCLCYKWLKSHFDKKIAFLSTILFLSAAPFIFHSHRHLMFVNYMPFLFLALFGVDFHFKKKNSNFLILGISLMILTSYYYSIGGLFGITIYAIYCYLKEAEKVTLKSFFLEALRYSIPVFLGVFISSILLFPTISVILSGRTELNNSISIFEVLIPSINMDALLYSSYSLGLTSIALISLLFLLFSNKKETRFLTISLLVLLLFPIFSYLLNGTLYLRSKVFIPFLPLFIYEISLFFTYLEEKKLYPIPSFLFLGIVVIIIFLSGYKEPKFYLDLTLTVLGLLAYYFWKKKFLYEVPIILFALSIGLTSNLNETYVTKEKYNQIYSTSTSLIQKILKEDPSFYRTNLYYELSSTMNKVFGSHYYSTTLYSSTYHDGYKNFFEKEFHNALPLRNILDEASTKNGLFNLYMGVKYFVGEEAPIGYQKISTEENLSVYKSEDALPLGYVSSKVSSLKEYQNTSYPYNLENLYYTVVVDKEVESSVEHHIKEVTLNVTQEESDLEITKTENGYTVESKKNTTLTLDLKEPIVNQYLFLSFDLKEIPSCSAGDISITINGEKNKLTCREWMYFNQNTSFEYVLSSNEPITSLKITFSKGTFEIENIQTYLLDYSTIQNRKSEVDEFYLDENTKGDTISGTVEVTQDGYFILNVPYDKGFTVKVNGEEVKTEIVNTTFLGFPLEVGTYNIVITYETPYQKLGKIVSLTAFIFWGVLNIFYKKRRKS